MRSPSVEGCEDGGVWALTRLAVWRRRARDADVVWEYFILVKLIATVISFLKSDKCYRENPTTQKQLHRSYFSLFMQGTAGLKVLHILAAMRSER